MVRLIFLLLLPIALFGAVELKVSVSSQPDAQTGKLIGTLVVIHSPNNQVDPSSFVLEGNPLPVILLEEKQVRNQQEDTYRFFLEPKPKGIHVLPSIELKVGDRAVATTPIAFQVAQSLPETDLFLQAIVQGEEPIYPGQRLVFLYRMYFRQAIELKGQNLPLLEPTGFTKIGSIRVREYTDSGYNVQEFSQVVEAVEPGKYLLGPSYIEGTLPNGSPVLAQAPTLTLSVLPFPTAARPTSFTGAIGNYSTTVERTSPERQAAQDPVALAILIQGGVQENPPILPDLLCQPGISGFFRMKEPPSVVQNTEEGILYMVELYPVSDLIQQVPPISFSFYDREKKGYQTIKSDPIPLSLYSLTPQKAPHTVSKIGKTLPEHPEEPIQAPYYITERDLQRSLVSAPYILLGAFLLLLSIAIQYAYKKRKRQPEKRDSATLLHRLVQNKIALPDDLEAIEEILFLRLQEAKIISSKLQHIDDLPRTGAAKKVRLFLLTLQEGLYGEEKSDFPKVAEQIEEVYREI